MRVCRFCPNCCRGPVLIRPHEPPILGEIKIERADLARKHNFDIRKEPRAIHDPPRYLPTQDGEIGGRCIHLDLLTGDCNLMTLDGRDLRPEVCKEFNCQETFINPPERRGVYELRVEV